jgi:hypothetical protein
VPQTLEESVNAASQSRIISTLIKRLKGASSRRPDPIRFQLVVMNQITTKFIQKRSGVQIESLPERHEMEDSSEVADFLLEVKSVFDRYAIKDGERTRILVSLHNDISQHMLPKLI